MDESARSSDSLLPESDDRLFHWETVIRGALYWGVAVSLAAVAYAGYRAVQDRAVLKAGQDRLVARHGLVQSMSKHLAPGYADSDGGLVADPPRDAEKRIDPETLVVAHYEGDDDDSQARRLGGFSPLP